MRWRKLPCIFARACCSTSLTNLQRDAEVFITHLKPGQIELTMQEIEDCIGEFRPGMLQNNQLFEI
jgi:hypothetical protein